MSLVDLSGETQVFYAPLGIMLLQASLEADERLAGRVEVSLHPFLAGTSLAAMAQTIAATTPDLIGLSCQGWNVATYRQLLPTLRQLLPEATVVLGGNHVSHQGDRWLRQLAEADVVVSGEGERTVCDLVCSLLDNKPRLSEIPGITYREDDELITTPDRPRVSSLEELPSAYAAPGVDLDLVDVALVETDRGCPYHCSFCYWGGAVGQKLTRAELDRFEAELEAIGKAGIGTIFLCDANFGILRRDVEVARMIVRIRERYGSPHTVHVNWAKNHATTVEEILAVLRAGNVHTNVFLALQTMSRPALRLAGRDERGRAEMMDLAHRIISDGGQVGAELIFGLPGETLEEFRSAYDELLLSFPSLLLHPLWILPNTTYDADRQALGLVTIRPDPTVDYEGVLRHRTLSVADNRAGLRLLLADEILIGSGYARTVVRGMARWAGLRPTDILSAFARFVGDRTDVLSGSLADAFDEIDAECYFHRRLRSQVRSAVYGDRATAGELLLAFIDQMINESNAREACRHLATYDSALLPRTDLDGAEGGDTADSYLAMPYDIHAVARAFLTRDAPLLPVDREPPVRIRLRHPVGFARHLRDAIDLSARWSGRVVDVTRM
ncbi:B12-binding domain-containing radical SAM protein [Actinoallomurus vinaceus]|uniref:B12-binding domain-containing radical SAM protein n=1 Tax=Actinoallomurus vinaceus TaxID=1080074 RepID=UPI0031EA19C7